MHEPTSNDRRRLVTLEITDEDGNAQTVTFTRAGGWTKRTGPAGEPSEPLVSVVCRLLGGCEPGAVIERLEAVIAGRDELVRHVDQAHCLDLTEALGMPHEGTIAEVRSWDQLLGRVRSLVDENAGLRDEAEDAATEQAELAQVDIDDLHRELERLRGVLRSAEPRAAEAEDRARAAEEAQRAAEQWVENLRDERDALRAEVDRLVGSHFHAKVVSLSLRAEVDRLRGALERADEEMRRHVAERDDLRARIEAMATERARLVIAAYAVVEAAEKDVPSDEEIAAMAKEVSDG